MNKIWVLLLLAFLVTLWLDNRYHFIGTLRAKMKLGEVTPKSDIDVYRETSDLEAPYGGKPLY